MDSIDGWLMDDDDDEQVMMPWRDDAAASVLSVRVRFTI